MSDDDSPPDNLADDGDGNDSSFNKYYLILIIAGVAAIVVGYFWWRRRRNLLLQRKHHNDVRAIARDIESSARTNEHREHRWSYGTRRSGRFHGLRSGRFTRTAWGLHDIPEIPPSYQASITDKEMPSTSCSDVVHDDDATLASAPGVSAEAKMKTDPPTYVESSRRTSGASESSKDGLRLPPQAVLAPTKD